jgi:hypothetical protein
MRSVFLSLCLSGLLAMVAGAPAALAQTAPPMISPAPQRVGGQTFAATARVGDALLQLNGVGMRAALIYKVYATGLYLPHRVDNPAAAYAEPGAKRIEMRMLMDAPAAEFAKAFDKGLAKSLSPEQLLAMKDRIDAFDRIVLDLAQLKDGDVILLDYLPDRGLVLTYNGKVRGAPVAGADLYQAFLAIFLGERPVDKKMKSGLLGLLAY